ncbi:MAG: tetratricopeptide repeat protein [Rhodocyclales bacterium]|nr:tetratricopeptide repeat protein [Rhodocyclales bacterium]
MDALAASDRLVAMFPRGIESWLLRGEILLALGRLPEAVAALDAGLAIDPVHVDSLLLRAAAQQALGRIDAALADYGRVTSAQPACADAHHNIGVILSGKGELEVALASLDKAIAARPNFPEAINQRGVVLKRLGRMDEALEAFKLAVALRPTYLAALRNQPDLLGALKQDRNALIHYDRALEIYPDDPILHNNRGTMLQAMGRYEEALVSYRRALQLHADYPDALNNCGTTLEALDRFDEAEASIRKALRFDPGKISAHWNLSLTLLRTGQMEEGWREHEWRWKKEIFQRFIFGFTQPRWDGTQALAGKTVLLTAEQGFGDSIQFVRYSLLLRRRGATVLLLVPRALIELFAHSLPVAGVFSTTPELPSFDFHIPLLSLPLAFATTVDTVPADIPYLKAPWSRCVSWEQKLPRRAATRIGLVWAGSPSHTNDMHRSLSLSMLEPLLQTASCEFVVLQKEISEDDRRIIDKHPELVLASDKFEDFCDTAAAISTLDLVITVDTSVAHLAGAMGKPVWILIPLLADWRWLRVRADSPWYPTARLYRRRLGEDWQPVIDHIRRDLLDFRAPQELGSPSPAVTGVDDALKAAVYLHNNGRPDDAIAIYRGVLQIDPDNFDANHLLAIACRAKGSYGEAESLARRALQLRPGNRLALKCLARTLMYSDKHEASLLVNQTMAELDPDNAEIWSDRAFSLIALKRHAEALENLDRALALKPDDAHALNNRGVMLTELGRPAEALASIDHALRLLPGFIDAIGNRGLALLALARVHDAIENYRQGLELHPQSPTLLCNLGISWMALNRHREAIECFTKALAIAPGSVDAHWNLALSQLTVGDFPQGWQHYEWRWKRPEMAPHRRRFHVPMLSASADLAGRRILLHYEQGFGDTLQFLRYVRPLEARGAKLIVAVPDALRRLAEASFPRAEVFAGDDVLPAFDLHCPMLSLPLACATTVTTIPPADPPYIRVPAEALKAWRKRLPAGKPCKIGLAWSGNPSHKHDGSRSLGVEMLRPLLDIPGTRFYSLQKDVRERDREILREMPKLTMLGSDFADFADTAAAISRMDLVISVDTSVAHLAGAMGKPVWILLPHAADWRWLTDRENSPWYPSARLVRQQEGQQVGDLMVRLHAELDAFRKTPKP